MTECSVTFDYWGQGLTIECDDPDLFQKLTNHFNLELCYHESAANVLCRFQLAQTREADNLLPLPGEPIQLFPFHLDETFHSEFNIYADGGIFYYDLRGIGRYRIDPVKRQADIVVYEDALIPTIYQVILLAESPIRQLVRDRFFVHAGCLCMDNHGFLISGPSGAGKSTATLALALTGASILTDDAAYIHKICHEYEAFSISRMLKVRQDALDRFFPELAKVQTKQIGIKEVYYPIGDLPNCKQIKKTKIQAVFALGKTNDKKSCMQRVSPLKIVPAIFPVTLSNLDVKKRANHFDKLTEMLNELQCYQLSFGTDMNYFVACMQEWVATQSS